MGNKKFNWAVYIMADAPEETRPVIEFIEYFKSEEDALKYYNEQIENAPDGKKVMMDAIEQTPKKWHCLYAQIKREIFIKDRYERFRKAQAVIEQYPEDIRKHIYLTDLDVMDSKSGKPVAMLVLCDGCNEDIQDEQFIMYAGSRVYHKKCAYRQGMPFGFFDQDPYLPEDESDPQIIDNVIGLEQYRKRMKEHPDV